MDNMDTCRTKKMDANKVWQWRIMYVKKYSRRPDPFYYSSRIGLDFNVASSTQKKLDLQLVTNGVILEICDFAKTVNKSKRRFMTNILENNFDLGFENEQQRIDFSARIHYKVKELIRKPPNDKNEVFSLFDTSSKPECNSNYALTSASSERLVEMDDTDDSEHEDEIKFSQRPCKGYLQTEGLSKELDEAPGDDNEHKDEFKCSQGTSKEYLQTEDFSEETGEAPGDDNEHEEEFKYSQGTSKEYLQTEDFSEETGEAPGDDNEHEEEFKYSGAQSADELKEDFLPPLFPYCEGIGLNLDVGSKQSLDPDLLTKGVMLELVHFTRILTASYSPIVLDVLEHNFELDLKRQQGKNRVWFKISHLLRKRNRFLATGTKISPEFKDEQFSFQTNPFKRTKFSTLSNMEASQYHLKEVMKRRQSDLQSNQKKRALSRSSERVNKRHRRGQFEDMETNSLCHHTDLCSSEKAEGDHCHTFPLGVSDQDLDKVTNPGYTGNLDHLQSPKTCSLNSDIAGDLEDFCVALSTTEISSRSPTVNSNVNPKEPTQTPRNASNKHNMEQEEMETEIMWKLRANRVKQILSSPNKEFRQFTLSKKAGVEFNVGFGPKQHISVDSLSNPLLLEVAKFALAMNSSQQDFIMEILEYNFDFGLQNQYQRDLFKCEIMNRVRKLRSCEDAVKFSKEVFQLPGPMSSKINMANQSVDGVNPELSSELRIKECAVVLVCLPHSHAKTKPLISQKIVDLYPFCKKIGLKLHVNKIQPNKKLDITKLTNGAMTEVTNFAERLCGTFEQICLDILGHNLDLDLQSGDSDLARDIVKRIPAAVEQKNLLKCSSLDWKIKGTGTDSSTTMELDCQNSPNLDPSSAGSSQAAIIDQHVDTCADIEQQDEYNLMLWKLRASHVEHILSVPHEEQCPFYSYPRCKKLGIDFKVGLGVKQNLDPTLLTNGIMVELNTFATALKSSQKYFITDILEYNFHLDFKSDLHRSAFAHETWLKIVTKRQQSKSCSRMKRLFELPDLRCVQESTMYCPRCYQVRNDKRHRDESDPGHMHHPRPHTMTDTVPADGNCLQRKPAKDLSSTLSVAVETMIDRYPGCKQIGLSLCVDKDKPKEKVDLHLLTNAIMNDVFSFTFKLCGAKKDIMNDVIEHNFKIGMQKRDVDPGSMFPLVAQKNDGSQAWLSKVYVIQPCPQKQLRHASEVKQATSMRRGELKEVFEKRKLALQNKDKATGQEEMGTESNYTCPLEESDLDLDDVTDSGGEEQTQPLRNEPNDCDMEQEEMGTESNYTCPLEESDLDLDDVTDSGGEEPTQILRNEPNECDMEQEEMETEIMWKLRSNRVKQILSSPNKEFRQFPLSKKAGLEFNVGFGPKQYISVDSLSNPLLLEVAKFALAMNSSQQDFIMEILEYNFDFGLQSQYQRDLFKCEIMNRVRKLRSCEDAVKFSKEVFQLPGPMSSKIDMANQSVDVVNPELSSELRIKECAVVLVCLPHSHAKTKPLISQKIVDLYPFCKKIGLKLHVNKIQPNKKLDITKLTNGAMTEVTNFAERLCGTFEQICLDILRHNLDLDLQSGDSDLARDIVKRIPAAVEQKNLLKCSSLDWKIKGTGTDSSTTMELDCQNSPNLDPSSAGSSQAAIIDQHVDTSADIEPQDEYNLMLWKLRANIVEHILSLPHEEQCPFYSYSRCKQAGIDFNVGSGVKQNLDPTLLTNGIMVELNTFATVLKSSQKYFITDILEYNFHLDFKSELHRSAFSHETWLKIVTKRQQSKSCSQMKRLFELPDLRCVQESTKYCPRCYQVRNDKRHRDESDPGHMHHPRPHTMTDTVPADGNCLQRKPAKDLSSTLSVAVETMIDRYPGCKQIGLNLCVDKDQPKEKVDLHLLTNAIMNDVFSFTFKLCGTKKDIMNDVIEHNFKIGMQKRDVDPGSMFLKVAQKNSGSQAWLSQVYVIQPCPQKQLRHASEVKQATSMRRGELKEVFEKRKLALQNKDKATAQEEMGTESNYTCPLEESDLDLDDVTDSGGEEQTQPLRNEPNDCDMEQEEMGTEINLWRLRANRVKQILSSPNNEVSYFTLSKKAGLEFNVGFGPKQHISVDSLSNLLVLEVAKFALAMNSSQQDFIMEILEYNFDFGLQSQHQRDLFSRKIMKSVRKLRSYEDAVKFSKEVFELPGPMLSVNMANQSMVSADPELSNELRMEECDVAPVCPSDSHAESKEHMSEMMMDPYPFCKEIGLKLHVNNQKQNAKLDINKLTSGAMTEVTNFAEKLCGTFEQICLDILRHNFDFDLQSGDSDLVRSIVEQIPIACEQKNISKCVRPLKEWCTKATKPNQDCQNDQTLDASSVASSQAAVMDDNSEPPNELELKLWKLRANQVQHILSVPHGEHCPLYSYSRCKQAGIDFNVGSGVKQNLDPKLLTNGIMVELNTFANALLSSERFFMTEILEYNFHLDFNDELYRSAFALQTWRKARRVVCQKSRTLRMNIPFELPDIQEPTPDRLTYCPKCYQDRNSKLDQDESDLGEMHHPPPHTMSDTVSADANCTEQKPAKDPPLTSSATEEMCVDVYRRCKKVGLNLCVNKDQPKEKLDLHVLTNGIMVEVVFFAKKLCLSKNKTIHAIIEHNFNIGMQRQDVDPGSMFLKVAQKNSGSQAWLSQVFVIQSCPQKQLRHASEVKQATSMRRGELKEVFEKRKLALQNKDKATAQEEMGTESNYTCPLEESDLDLDDVTDSGGEEQTQPLRNEPNDCDMEQEEMGTEINLWRLRANRVKQILSSPSNEVSYFTLSKKAGLEFNVGFGPKQHISVDSLSNLLVLEVAKFALAMNSSQQDFIMEILEYNFDFGLQSQHQRDLFSRKIMKSVRKLRSYEDAVKFSKEVFELPGPMLSVNMANQSMVSADPELSNELRMEECDVAPVCPSDSHAESKEHMSEMMIDPYPFCKEIGLKLHVNNQKQNAKLDINKLTSGAMTEVTNFAEKLCGTFEQICLDILRHNFDFDLQSGDSDLVRSIVEQIPVAFEQKNISKCARPLKEWCTKATKPNQDCQNDQTLDASSVVSSQAAVMDDNSEPPNELELKLWKLRANQMQHILSVPHGEHCPLYSYSRCKQAGIDFNVASGVKQNLDRKLLTNGIMVELNTFAIALLLSERFFITEILEYNFHLDLNDELYRSAFALQTWRKARHVVGQKSRSFRMNMPFELPDIQEPTPDRLAHCPKCYQDRNSKLDQDESDLGEMHHPRPHTMSDTVSADANCTEQKPAKDPPLTSSATEEMLVDVYRRCKKVGLNLCVNKDQPKEKLDLHVLTNGIMVEVAAFAKKLCVSKNKTIHAIIEHNFNIGLQRVEEDDILQLFRKAKLHLDLGHAFLDEVFVFKPSRPPRDASKPVEASVTQISERKETFKKRMLALQTKEERPTLPSPTTSVIKSKRHQPGKVKNCFPLCTEIGLDLDVTSKSAKKEKLDLKLLTRAVVYEIHKFVVKYSKPGDYLPPTLFDILDYNFDLSSQHHRRWEFSIATSSKILAMVKQRNINRNRPHEVFKLPFEFELKRQNKTSEKCSKKKSVKKTKGGSNVHGVRHHSDVNRVHFHDSDKTNEGAGIHNGLTQLPTDPGTIVPMNRTQVSVGCGSPLQGNIQKKEEEWDPHYGNMKSEPDTEMFVPLSGSPVSEGCDSPLQGNAQIKEEYNPHHGNMKPESDTEEKHDVKMESTTKDVKHLVPGMTTGVLGYMPVILFPNSVGPQAGLQNHVQCYILADPQGSAVCPNTVSNITPRLNTEGVQYLVPVQAMGSPMVTIGQGNGSTLIKQEQENVPVDSHQGLVHKK